MFAYLYHLLVAKGPDRVHSPFVFDLYFHTLRSKYRHYSFKSIEKKHSSESDKSSPLIGQSIFKIINKFSPQKILVISDYSEKICNYISTAKKSSSIDSILGDKISTSSITKRPNVQLKKIDTINLRETNYDLIVIDIITDEFDLNSKDIINCPIIINTNIKSNKFANKNWMNQQSSSTHNVQLDFFHFGVSIIRNEQKKEYFRLRL